MTKLVAAIVAAAALVLAGVSIGEHRAASRPAKPARPATQADVAPTRPAPSGTNARRAERPQLESVTREPPDRGRSTADLARDVRDADPRVRRAAIAETRDVPTLLAASRDPDLDVALAATSGLGRAYREGTLPASELVARASDLALPGKVRIGTINGLGSVAGADSASALTALLARGDDNARRAAAIELANQNADIAIPALIAALADADALVRTNAHASLRSLAHGRDFGADAAAWLAWSRTG